MAAEPLEMAQLVTLIESLRREVAALRERVEQMEARRNGTIAPVPVPTREPEEISEDIVLVLSAAVAAMLGKKAPIRQIRVLGSSAWSQQGRVVIQASHHLP
jgi:methylmalonyl-CoA carboxyltransferase large subunit